jgi:hypothetical protein
MDQNEIPHDPRHLAVSLCASKMIFEPMVCSAQTVHLSCVKVSSISKQPEISFHLSLITEEYNRARPKWFLSRCYVWRKLWTYLSLTLTLSPNGPKWDSTWPTSPSSSIGCIQNNLWAYGTFDTKRAPILCQDYHYLQMDRLTVSPNGPKWDSTWPTSPSSFIVCVQNDFHASGMFSANHALSCVKVSSISKWTETSFHLSLVT